jgi:hypothetical protein
MDSTIGCLHDPAEKPFGEADGIGLLIMATGRHQRHVGILFKDPDDDEAQVQVLDLQRHHRVGVTQASVLDGYLWAAPSIKPRRAYVLAKLCGRIAKEYARGDGKIAYALRYTGQRFDNDGVYMSEGGLGLTCATFVMAVFVSRGSALLSWGEWQDREEDHAWLQSIETHLCAWRADPKHIAAVKQEAARGCARFRPEEVAAAGVGCELPVGFAYAERIGKQIVARVPPPRRT